MRTLYLLKQLYNNVLIPIQIIRSNNNCLKHGKQCLYAHKGDFSHNYCVAHFAEMLVGDKSPNPKIVNKVDGCAFIKR